MLVILFICDFLFQAIRETKIKNKRRKERGGGKKKKSCNHRNGKFYGWTRRLFLFGWLWNSTKLLLGSRFSDGTQTRSSKDTERTKIKGSKMKIVDQSFRPMLISLNLNLNPIIEGNPMRVITRAITTISWLIFVYRWNVFKHSYVNTWIFNTL